jgi:hypothetical protein
MEQGTILAVHFKSDEYLQFINFCFTNVLISGAQVKIIDAVLGEAIVFVSLAAPGIDRIDRVVVKFNGHIVL